MMDCVCVTVAEESVENRELTGTTDIHVSVSPEIATAEHAPIGYVGRSWYSLLDDENTDISVSFHCMCCLSFGCSS